MIEVYRGSINTWECDEMGHMNVRFYVAKSMEGLAEFAHAVGLEHAFRAGGADGQFIVCIDEKSSLVSETEGAAYPTHRGSRSIRQQAGAEVPPGSQPEGHCGEDGCGRERQQGHWPAVPGERPDLLAPADRRQPGRPAGIPGCGVAHCTKDIRQADGCHSEADRRPRGSRQLSNESGD